MNPSNTLRACGLSLITVVAMAGCGTHENGTKPTVTPPANQSVECDGNGNQAALNAWLNSATFTEGCGGGTITNNFQALSDGCGATGAVTVTWTVTDLCGNSESASAIFSIVDTTDPALIVPQPITVTCGDAGTADALQAWAASATSTDACGNTTITSQRTAAPGSCTATMTWTATDECGNATSASSTYTTNGDTTPPTMTLNGSAAITVECGAAWVDAGVTINDNCDALIQPTITGDLNLHLSGVYVLTYAAIDACGNIGPSVIRTITVVDTTPPVVTPGTRDLWPPNHDLHTFTLADVARASDACEGDLDLNVAGVIIDIYSDEPDNANGDGNTTGDIVIVDDHTFSVRAERQGGGNGRVYGIRFVVTDSSGNHTEATAFVQVPHDQSGSPAVDDGAASGHVVTR